MKQYKQIKNWWIDVLMFIGYLFCFYLEFTGVAGHEWLGVCIAVLAILHTWLHWDWIVGVTRRFFKCAGSRSRWFYLVDVLIVFGFVVILETGLVISTWLDLDIMNYVTWLDIHLYASYVTLALLVIKVGIHWRWVVNTTGKIFGSLNKPVPANELAPIPVPVKVSKDIVDRRRFLGLMGVVGMGSILAVINVIRENSLYSVSANNDVSAYAINDIPSDTTGQVATAESPSQSIGEASDDSVGADTAAVSTPEPENQSLPASSQPVLPPQDTPSAVAACQAQCSKHCAFPGRCRRYVDQNGNGFCDLGECV